MKMSDISFLKTELNPTDLKIQKSKTQNSARNYVIHIKQHTVQKNWTEKPKLQLIL